MDWFFRVVFGKALDLDIDLASSRYKWIQRTLPRCLLARFLGRKAKEPWRGASNFLWDILIVCLLVDRVAVERKKFVEPKSAPKFQCGLQLA